MVVTIEKKDQIMLSSLVFGKDFEMESRQKPDFLKMIRLLGLLWGQQKQHSKEVGCKKPPEW